MQSIRTLHPCQYCRRSCYGLQCRKCHIDMIASRSGECRDCKQMFIAIRKDGSKRVRCQSCQELYFNKYIRNCEDCNANFHSVMKDGRVFKKCLTCFKKNFVKCINCNNNTHVSYPMCKTCYINKNDNSSVLAETSSIIGDENDISIIEDELDIYDEIYRRNNVTTSNIIGELNHHVTRRGIYAC